MPRQAEEHDAAHKHSNALRARGSPEPAASPRDWLMPEVSGSRSTVEWAGEAARWKAMFYCHFSAKQRNQLQDKIQNQKGQTHG